jgi:transposase
MGTHPVLPQALWAQLPPEVQAYIEALEERQASMGALEARVVALEALVQSLQEQLNQTSRNSSRPPSSDSPQHSHPRRPWWKRRRGGQPGHPGHTRTLLPVADVDEVVVLKPEQRPHCHTAFTGDDPMPWRHQVIEIPPLKPIVTEYQWHQLVCAACGEVTRAPWPVGVPSGT